MTKRTTRQQTKHDNTVKKTAQYYKSRKYKVDADIEGFDRPKVIGRRRPDLVIKKGKKVIIVEVETKDSIQRDKDQQKVFQNYADKHKNVEFRTKIAK